MTTQFNRAPREGGDHGDADKASQRPIRVALFDRLDEVDRVVNELLAAQFDKEHISVICSDDTRQAQFAEFQPSSIEHPSRTLAVGEAAVGAALGALVAATGLATVGGAAVVAAGAMAAAMAGGVAGGLTGAMMGRGLEKEPADYYDQAVQDGKILVAVEYSGDDQHRRLAQASQILGQTGSSVYPLREG